jgi:hypothetical protein
VTGAVVVGERAAELGGGWLGGGVDARGRSHEVKRLLAVEAVLAVERWRLWVVYPLGEVEWTVISKASALGYSSGVGVTNGLKTLSKSELMPLCRVRLFILLAGETSNGVCRRLGFLGEAGLEKDLADPVTLGSSYFSNCDSVKLRR